MADLAATGCTLTCWTPHYNLVYLRYAGILSAVGIHLADIVQEAQEPAATELQQQQLPSLTARLDALAATAVDALKQQGFQDQQISTERFLNLR